MHDDANLNGKTTESLITESNHIEIDDLHLKATESMAGNATNTEDSPSPLIARTTKNASKDVESIFILQSSQTFLQNMTFHKAMSKLLRAISQTSNIVLQKVNTSLSRPALKVVNVGL